MSYLSPSRSPMNILTSKKSQTVSLPSLNKPQREQINSFLSQDRDKIRQRLKEAFFQKDISYLKESPQPKFVPVEPLQPIPETKVLPTALTEIFAAAYPDVKFPHSLIKLVSSHGNKTQPDLKKLLQTPKNPDFFAFPTINPSSRQETLNLKQWLESTEARFVPVLSEVVNTPGFEDKSLALKAWKSIYLMIYKEIVKQVTIGCAERGNLLQKVLTQMENVHEIKEKLFEEKLVQLERLQEMRIKEFIQPYIEEVALLESKVQRLEKEKEKWTKTRAEMIVKSKELIRYMEVLRKFEDQIKHLKGKSMYFDEYINFFNSIAVEEMNDFSSGNVKDKLKDELTNIVKDLFVNKQKLKDEMEKLRLLEDDIIDKESKLANIVFEIEIKENLARPKLRKSEKFLSISEAGNNKKEASPSPIKPQFEDEATLCELFFKSIVFKSKERLMQKSKVSSDHIFKSLGVIYNRAVVQINSNPTPDSQNFQFLLYKQFVKSENRKKSERILKNFLSGCLKLSDSKRVSVFLRLLNFGGWINKEDFSYKSFLLYLSLFLFMQNSTVGLLMYKDQLSPIQYHPYARALACLTEYETVLGKARIITIKDIIEKNKITDPKQINPSGIVELELVFEAVLEEYEKMLREIVENIESLFLPFGERVGKDVLRLGLVGLAEYDKEKVLEIEKETEKKNEFLIAECIDVAARIGVGSNEVVNRILAEFVRMSDEECKGMAKGKLEGVGGKIAEQVVGSIEKVSASSVLVWVKILVS